MRFSTAKARDDFAQFVLNDMHPIEKVYELARVLDQRMLAKNDGRMWMGAHMRRGDCKLDCARDCRRLTANSVHHSCRLRMDYGKGLGVPLQENKRPPRGRQALTHHHHS